VQASTGSFVVGCRGASAMRSGQTMTGDAAKALIDKGARRSQQWHRIAACALPAHRHGAQMARHHSRVEEFINGPRFGIEDDQLRDRLLALLLDETNLCAIQGASSGCGRAPKDRAPCGGVQFRGAASRLQN